MTESAALANEARKDCFNDLDVEEYIIVETLDKETCPLCGQLDGKVFKMSEYAVGLTAPPFHPWCRGTTAPYFADMQGVGERFARGADGKTYAVPKDMTYAEWYAKQTDENGRNWVDVERKKWYNEVADRQQWISYKETLGKMLQRHLESFKTSNTETSGGSFKAYTRSIKSGELTPLADFKLYTDIGTEIDKTLVGKKTANGIEIIGASKHFIARVIGSVEQRRNGVSLSSIKEAILHPTEIKRLEKSEKYILDGVCSVSVNQETGLLIQVNPLRRR